MNHEILCTQKCNLGIFVSIKTFANEGMHKENIFQLFICLFDFSTKFQCVTKLLCSISCIHMVTFMARSRWFWLQRKVSAFCIHNGKEAEADAKTQEAGRAKVRGACIAQCRIYHSFVALSIFEYFYQDLRIYPFIPKYSFKAGWYFCIFFFWLK